MGPRAWGRTAALRPRAAREGERARAKETRGTTPQPSGVGARWRGPSGVRARRTGWTRAIDGASFVRAGVGGRGRPATWQRGGVHYRRRDGAAGACGSQRAAAQTPAGRGCRVGRDFDACRAGSANHNFTSFVKYSRPLQIQSDASRRLASPVDPFALLRHRTPGVSQRVTVRQLWRVQTRVTGRSKALEARGSHSQTSPCHVQVCRVVCHFPSRPPSPLQALAGLCREAVPARHDPITLIVCQDLNSPIACNANYWPRPCKVDVAAARWPVTRVS